ncbi:MAG: sigma-54 dependent transcriptional regulator, partial [Ignavibacteriaceae bacterium]
GYNVRYFITNSSLTRGKVMPQKILVVDDEDIIRESLSFVLKKEGYAVEEAENGKAAYDKLLEGPFDLVITDIEMPQMKGTQLIEEIKKLNIQTSFIVITAFGSLDTAITALRSGATDYILKPVEFDELLIKVKRLFEIKSLLLENRILKKEIQRNYDFEDIVGRSPSIRKVYEMIQTVAETDSSVMITGKSGTGKELVARSLHFKSKRQNKPFIAVNCGAIAENLIESELFGHKKGAFTGAISDKEGLIKAADGGTLFLDEISELPLPLQVKFLRALQEREVTPVGTTISLPVNVRIIASTNRELKEEIKAGNFREDLYYRLNVIEIPLPSLKEREEDIPLLADHFLNKYRTEMNKNIKGIDNEVIRALISYEWKGEVRELENVMERAVIFCKNDFITLEDLPETFSQSSSSVDFSKLGSLEVAIRRFEKEYILKALESNSNDKEKTSELLQVGLSTLYRKLKELDITH